MTLRQRLLKRLYPVFLLIKKTGGKHHVLSNKQNIAPIKSIYELSVELSNGETRSLAKYKGKKILFVNTASDCGYTAQYAELQTLYRHSREDLEIIAFPSNDFKEQEKGSDDEIRQFCQSVYGVGFPLVKKSIVRKGENQHPVFQWLSQKELNGWNDQPPGWNFSKYLVNEEGMLTHYFHPAVSPVSEEMISAVHQ